MSLYDAAVDSAGLPGDPQLRSALTAYMTWATRDVLAFARRTRSSRRA